HRRRRPGLAARRLHPRFRGLAAAHPEPVWLQRGNEIMIVKPGFLPRHAVRLVALVLLFSLYGFTHLPRLAPGERAQIASRFAFPRQPLPEPSGFAPHTIRRVNPSLARISAWISSVGAAVALNDLDGDGLPNDLCYVDTRIDQVVVAPVPGTGA